MAQILVIDDENNIRLMARLALEHVGHTVESAADGPTGLDAFGDGSRWDVVLLDQRMPGMEGLEVLREIRYRSPEAQVIMVTAFGTIDLAVDAMKAGATDFLRKPFTVETLRSAVQAATQGRPPAASGGADEPTGGLTVVTLNGFRIEPLTESAADASGDIANEFRVRSPDGAYRKCTVVVRAYVVELVKAHADRESLPGGDRFWRMLCGEVLSNYVWQNAQFPPGDALTLDELPTGQRRWVDSMLRTAS